MGSNGDSLHAEAVGQATENRTPGMLNVVDIYKITGGTGRFSGASGTITLNRLVSVTTGAAVQHIRRIYLNALELTCALPGVEFHK